MSDSEENDNELVNLVTASGALKRQAGGGVDPAQWTVQQVNDWLCEVDASLAQHADAVRREKVDGEKLLHVTYPGGESVLRGIGITDEKTLKMLHDRIVAVFSLGESPSDEEPDAAEVESKAKMMERLLAANAQYVESKEQEQAIRDKLQKQKVVGAQDIFAHVKDTPENSPNKEANSASFRQLLQGSIQPGTEDKRAMAAVAKTKAEAVNQTETMMKLLSQKAKQNVILSNEDPEIAKLNAEIEQLRARDAEEERERQEAVAKQKDIVAKRKAREAAEDKADADARAAAKAEAERRAAGARTAAAAAAEEAALDAAATAAAAEEEAKRAVAAALAADGSGDEDGAADDDAAQQQQAKIALAKANERAANAAAVSVEEVQPLVADLPEPSSSKKGCCVVM